jgi:hypothetical protein
VVAVDGPGLRLLLGTDDLVQYRQQPAWRVNDLAPSGMELELQADNRPSDLPPVSESDIPWRDNALYGDYKVSQHCRSNRVSQAVRAAGRSLLHCVLHCC